MWDVVVVGAGPAGASAALAARRANGDARVLLLDRADFPRDKACGDGIAPHVLDVLTTLGLHRLVEDWEPVSSLELQYGPLNAVRRMRRPAWVVPRAVFDARLVDAAVTSGVELRRHHVRRVDASPGGVLLDGSIAARVVIAADGAYSVLRRAVLPGATGTRAFALRGYAPTPTARLGRQVIRFGRAARPSYAWSFDRGDGWSNVGYGEVCRASRGPMSRTGMVQAMEALLPGTTQDAVSWRGHHLPLSSYRWHQPDGRVLLAGDAAGLVNPLTGEGIYYAVATGVVAGSVAARCPGAQAGSRHRQAVRRLLAAHLRTTAAIARVVALPGVLPAGIRAARAEQQVFDDLVEAGLGRGLLTPAVVTGLLRHALA
jgi:menaquinone-9 beta-reductase